MKTLTIQTTENKHRLDLPDCFEETSTRIYQNLIKRWIPENVDILKRSPETLFKILAQKEINISIKDLPVNSPIWQAMKFVYEQPTYLDILPLPNFFIIEGKKIAVPVKVDELSIGQNIMMKQVIESVKDLREAIAKAIAIYLQPKVDGSFNDKRVNEIEEEVLEMPITSTYTLGFFLLNRLIKSGWKHSNVFQRLLTTLTKAVRNYWLSFREWMISPRLPI